MYVCTNLNWFGLKHFHDPHFSWIFLYIYQASEAMSAHKKGLGNPLSSGHKHQSTSKKFEAPSKYIFKL